jgi:hypothetical protein
MIFSVDAFRRYGNSPAHFIFFIALYLDLTTHMRRRHALVTSHKPFLVPLVLDLVDHIQNISLFRRSLPMGSYPTGPLPLEALLLLSLNFSCFPRRPLLSTDAGLFERARVEVVVFMVVCRVMTEVFTSRHRRRTGVFFLNNVLNYIRKLVIIAPWRRLLRALFIRKLFNLFYQVLRDNYLLFRRTLVVGMSMHRVLDIDDLVQFIGDRLSF